MKQKKRFFFNDLFCLKHQWIWYAGLWMWLFLQWGHRPGEVKRVLPLKAYPQLRHIAG
jgi:hypothetical protein